VLGSLGRTVRTVPPQLDPDLVPPAVLLLPPGVKPRPDFLAVREHDEDRWRAWNAIFLIHNDHAAPPALRVNPPGMFRHLHSYCANRYYLPNHAVPAFTERLDRHGNAPGWVAVLAYTDDGEAVGYAYGNVIDSDDRWWKRVTPLLPASTPIDRP
jgi:hypothetical protein